MQRNCIVIVTLAIVVLGFQKINAIDRSFMRDEGPFEANVHNASNCVKEQPWFHSNITVYTSNGRRMLRGTFSSQRQMKNVKFLVQIHYIEAGKVKAFEMKNQNCHNFVIRIILQGLKARYDARRCTMEPGTSEFSDLDLNAVFHSVVQSLYYGLVQVRLAIATPPTATVFCLDVNMQFVKLRDNATSTR